ncbi:MAG: leucine-rich repeat domain-containing protein [Bacillota bacterium]
MSYEFNKVDNLRSKKVELPKSITKISRTALQNNPYIRKISFNENLQVIDAYAFQNCISLETLYFPRDTKIRIIPKHAFDGCQALKHISLPSSLVSIQAYAFKDCTEIKTLTIPVDVTSVDIRAFSGFNASQEIIVYKDYGVFKDCKATITNLSDDEEGTKESLEIKAQKQRYFAVTCKCGHVRKGYYIPITFPIIAKNRKAAARLARQKPRVKHHHKYAILRNEEIPYTVYKQLQEANKNDNYLNVKSTHQQKQYQDEIKARRVKEPKKPFHSNESLTKKILYNSKERIRKPKRYDFEIDDKGE